MKVQASYSNKVPVIYANSPSYRRSLVIKRNQRVDLIIGWVILTIVFVAVAMAIGTIRGIMG